MRFHRPKSCFDRIIKASAIIRTLLFQGVAKNHLPCCECRHDICAILFPQHHLQTPHQRWRHHQPSVETGIHPSIHHVSLPPRYQRWRWFLPLHVHLRHGQFLGIVVVKIMREIHFGKIPHGGWKCQKCGVCGKRPFAHNHLRANDWRPHYGLQGARLFQ